MSTRTRMAQAALGIKGFAAIWFLILAVSLSIKFIKRKKKWDALRISALSGMYGFFIAYGFESVIFIIEIATTEYSLWDNESFAQFQFLFWNLWYTVSWSSFYLFMLFRIKNAFNDTHSIYSVDLKILYLHSLIAIAAPILIIIAVFQLVVYKLSSAIWIVITFFGAFNLIYTFNYNLYSVILAQNEGGDKANLTEIQQHMIRTVTKHSVLGGLTLSCLALCSFTHIWGPLFGVYWVGIIFIHIGVVAISLSGLGIYLGFNCNRNLYLKLCTPCNDGTKKFYINRAKMHKAHRNSKSPSECQLSSRAMASKSSKESMDLVGKETTP